MLTVSKKSILCLLISVVLSSNAFAGVIANNCRNEVFPGLNIGCGGKGSDGKGTGACATKGYVNGDCLAGSRGGSCLLFTLAGVQCDGNWPVNDRQNKCCCSN
jgi:hypothetical protein